MDYNDLIGFLRQRAMHKKPYITPGETWTGGMVKDELCADAATAIETLCAENEKLCADLARVTAERDAAISDMEALMWFSGEGCRICAHAVEAHKEPYVRLDCNREKGTDCSPKWRGIKEGWHGTALQNDTLRVRPGGEPVSGRDQAADR